MLVKIPELSCTIGAKPEPNLRKILIPDKIFPVGMLYTYFIMGKYFCTLETKCNISLLPRSTMRTFRCVSLAISVKRISY